MIARKSLLFSALFLLATLLVLISRSLNTNSASLPLPRVDLFRTLDLDISRWSAPAHSSEQEQAQEHEHDGSHTSAPPLPDDDSSRPSTAASLTVTDLNPGNHSQIHSRARVGMVTMVLGKTNPTYERALRTHQVHAQRHGAPLFTLRKEILDIMYNKPMYVLDLLFQEMKKPDFERMEWFFWFDADTVIVNPQIPPSAFLPPRDYAHIHFLAALDVNGLNAGVFFLRVSDWAIEVMSAVLAYRTFRPEDALPFAEQTALDRVIRDDKFRRGTAFYPQRWFNAYQGAVLTNESVQPWQLHRGDMMVHFAGVLDKSERMDFYADIFDQHLPEWEIDLQHTTYPGEMEMFWDERRAADRKEQQHLGEMKEKAQELMREGRRRLEVFGQGLPREQIDWFEGAFENLRKVADKAEDLEKMGSAMANFTDASKGLDSAESDSKKDILRHAHEMILTAEKISDRFRELPDPELSAEPQKLGSEAAKLREFLIENPTKLDEVKVAAGALKWAIEHFREVWEPKISRHQEAAAAATVAAAAVTGGDGIQSGHGGAGVNEKEGTSNSSKTGGMNGEDDGGSESGNSGGAGTGHGHVDGESMGELQRFGHSRH